jgi:hypothetical protein
MNVYPNLSDGINIPNTYSLSCLVLDTISRSNFRDMTSWIQNIKNGFLAYFVFLFAVLLFLRGFILAPFYKVFSLCKRKRADRIQTEQ